MKQVLAMEALAGECKMGFARKLASPKNKTREKAISLLVLRLTSEKQIEEDELKKIWKGLFYCVWHSDKAPVQADLIERLASIFEKLDSVFSLQFFKVFLMTMRREWAGIDRLRLDKFYLLLRKCLAHMFVALERSGWDADLTKEFMDMLVQNAFLAKDQYAALGINLHYADIYLQELKTFIPLRSDTFKLLLEPFLLVYANASNKCLLRRIKANIFDHLNNIGRTVIIAKQEGSSLDPSIESFGSLLFNVPLGSEAFKLASMPSTQQANRKLLYKLHAECETLEKLFNTSGVTLSLALSAEKKKKKKKVLGQIPSIDKLKNREIRQKKVIKFSQRKAKCDPACDTVTTIVLDKGKGKRKNSEVFKEASLSAESTAGAGNITSNKRKVAEDFVLESKGEESLGSIKKKAKQRSTGKSKMVASVVGAAKKSCDLAEDSRLEQQTIANVLDMNNSVVSNLERQFDLLADESLIDSDTCLTPAASLQSKKRKRTISTPQGNGALVLSESSNDGPPTSGRIHGHSTAKVKRVRFALKKNLVWTLSTPLPAENVRVPPSATPRGSALKKGVPPGPIISTAVNAGRQRKGTPLRPSTYSKTSRNRKTVLKRVKLLAKQHRTV